MEYIARPYQTEAAAAGAQFLMGKRKNWNGIIIAGTGSGKSLIIALIVSMLDGPCIVFQPSKEILEQNLAKFQSYGYEPAIYSASKNRRQIGEITLVTVGSVRAPNYNDLVRSLVAFMLRLSIPPKDYAAELFEGIQYIIVDECDLVNPAEGLYKEFFDYLASIDRIKILGLTATPYRMASNSQGTELRFITRTVPRVFNEVVYWVDLQALFRDGYLAKLAYYQIKDSGFDRKEVPLNSAGSDYEQDALQLHLFQGVFKDKLAEVVERLLKVDRRNILVFVQFVRQAEELARQVPGVAILSSDTKKSERERILRDFQCGAIKVVVNCNVLSVGFDFPQLETVVLAAPTLSLRRYYQRIGRALRPHPDKTEAWIVDLVETYQLFGRVEDLKLYCKGSSQWYIAGRPGGPENRETQLTNVYLAGGRMIPTCKKCHSTNIFYSRHETTGNNAVLSRPSEGMKPNIVLKVNPKNPQGAKVYAIVPTGEGEFVNHRAVCKGSQRKAQSAVDAPAPWEAQQ